MKTKLTLLLVALLSAFAYAATTWQATAETTTEPGTTLIDNDLIVAKTVYATTLVSELEPVTIAGETFTHFIQVRVASDPQADNPVGGEFTEKQSTPIVVEAKKNASLTIYYRRQSTAQNKDPESGEVISGAFADNDKKDVKVYNQEDFSVLTGEMTIDHTTSDFKYGYATKKVELAEGGKYVIAAIGTTLSFYGMTVEGMVPPVPVMGEAINLAPATGADLAAELATAQAENPYPASITITLAADGAYTVGGTMNVNCPITIKGDAEKPATIDASALSAPVVQLTEDIHPDFTKTENLSKENEDGTVEVTVCEYTELDGVVFENVKVSGLKRQLFYANKQSVILNQVAVRNSIIAADGTDKKTFFDFNGGGNTKKLEVSNSTIYAIPTNGQNGGFFSTQSSKDVTEFNPTFTQEFNISNSTIYNVTNSKTVSTLRKNSQAHMKYVVKDNLIVASGKKNQFLSGLNAGQQGKVGNWDVSGNSFQWENVAEDGTATFEDILSGEKAANAVTEGVEGIVAFAGDYTTGDFTLAQCAQNTAKVGDPRWLVEPKSVFFEITDEEGLATYFNSQYAFIVPEGVQAGVVTTVDNLYSYAKYIYQAGSVVPAGVPVILKGEVKAYAADITAGGGQKPEENLLKGYDAFTEKETAPEYFYYKLSRSTHNGEKKLGFYWFTADGHTNLCKPNKAYLCLTEEQTANFIFLIEEATAIRNIETAESANEVYTINGVKVKGELQRGIYIINGKKTVVK